MVNIGKMSLHLAAILLAHLVASVMADPYQWQAGRATFYGGPGDPWSIHTGSCGYGYLDEGVGTGWDIAALADADWDYAGSCGRCYEVKCNPANFQDGYGAYLQRSGVCFDPDASVVITATDTCPCEYPTNEYSNKRWCCGDMQHLDLSIWAFEKLADIKWGVVGIQFRRVSCDYKPEKPAMLADWDHRSPASQSPPWNWSPSMDKRPKSQTSDEPSKEQQTSGSGDDVFFGGLKPGWTDQSYSSQKTGADEHSPDSPDYKADCSQIYSGGAVVYSGQKGAFEGYSEIAFWVKKGDGGPPALTFQLTGSKGFCRGTTLSSVAWDDEKGDWLHYTMPLNAFDWRTPTWEVSKATEFYGCSDEIGASEISNLELKNTQGWEQTLCIDQVTIV